MISFTSDHFSLNRFPNTKPILTYRGNNYFVSGKSIKNFLYWTHLPKGNKVKYMYNHGTSVIIEEFLYSIYLICFERLSWKDGVKIFNILYLYFDISWSKGFWSKLNVLIWRYRRFILFFNIVYFNNFLYCWGLEVVNKATK